MNEGTDRSGERSQELLALARAGDKDAFCELVKIHQASVRAFIARYVHDSDQVMDLAQDTFLAAYRRLHQFDSSHELFPWLRGIARNCALEYLRRTSRRRRREEAAMEESLALWSTERLERDDTGDTDYLQELKNCLAKLAESSARVVQLRYFQQLSVDEVAVELGRTEGSVRMVLMRLRQSLRKCIEDELHVEEAQE